MSDPNLHIGVKFPAHMTDEERTELINKIHAHREYARMARSLFDAEKGVNVLAATETDRITGEIVSLVNDVLATRAAEIARLQTRQITPEMMAVWDEYRLARDEQSARYLINATPDMRSDLWHAFIAMMTEQESDS